MLLLSLLREQHHHIDINQTLRLVTELLWVLLVGPDGATHMLGQIEGALGTAGLLAAQLANPRCSYAPKSQGTHPRCLKHGRQRRDYVLRCHGSQTASASARAPSDPIIAADSGCDQVLYLCISAAHCRCCLCSNRIGWWGLGSDAPVGHTPPVTTAVLVQHRSAPGRCGYLLILNMLSYAPD
jgi:hypothetical protein